MKVMGANFPCACKAAERSCSTCPTGMRAAQGAVGVSAYVTHGVFPRASYTRFIQANGTPNAFQHFWITDSCPRTVLAVEGQAPFQIISLAAPIAAALQI